MLIDLKVRNLKSVLLWKCLCTCEKYVRIWLVSTWNLISVKYKCCFSEKCHSCFFALCEIQTIYIHHPESKEEGQSKEDWKAKWSVKSDFERMLEFSSTYFTALVFNILVHTTKAHPLAQASRTNTNAGQVKEIYWIFSGQWRNQKSITWWNLLALSSLGGLRRPKPTWWCTSVGFSNEGAIIFH